MGMLHNMKRILALIPGFLFVFFFILAPQQPALAYVSGGKGSMALSPSSGTFASGNTSVNVTMNSGGTAISTFALELTFPVSGSDLTVSSVTPNAAFISTGWSFLVNSHSTSGSTTTIDLSGINLGTSGYVAPVGTVVATVTFNVGSSFTGKTISFNTSPSIMDSKSTGTDILGAVTNGTYSGTASTTSTATPTPTPTPTPTIVQAQNQTAQASSTPTPTATPTSAPYYGTVNPTCTSLTVNPTGGSTSSMNATLSCTGTAPNGYVSGAYFNFGDGATQTVSYNAGSPGTVTTTHTYSTVGTVQASCQIRDENQTLSSSCQAYVSLSKAPNTNVTYIYVTPIAAPTTITTPAVTQTNDTTPTPEITVIPTQIPTQAPTPKSTSFNPNWLIIGAVALVIIGAIIYFVTKRKPPQPKADRPMAGTPPPPPPPIQPPPSVPPPPPAPVS